MHTVKFKLILLLVTLAPALLFGQAVDTLRPGHQSRYLLPDGFMADCVEWMGQDPDGRFWYIACGPQQTEIGLKLFTFDGSKSYAVRLDTLSGAVFTEMINPIEIDSDGVLHGWIGHGNTLFSFDTRSGQTSTLSINNQVPGNNITRAVKVGKTFYTLMRHASDLIIHRIENGKAEECLRVPSGIQQSDFSNILEVVGDEVWCWATTTQLYRIPDNNGQPQFFELPDMVKSALRPEDKLYAEAARLPSGETLLVLVSKFDLDAYIYDPVSRQLSRQAGLTNRLANRITDGLRLLHADREGNVLLAYRDSHGKAHGDLFTPTGIKDMSLVLNACIKGQEFLKIYSTDFERSAVFYGREHLHCEVLAPSSILTINSDQGVRNMLTINGKLHFLNKVYDLDEQRIVHTYGYDEFSIGPRDIILNNGYAWSSVHGEQLRQYDLENNTILYHTLTARIDRFLFLDDLSILYAGESRYGPPPGERMTHFYRYEPESGKSEPLLIDGEEVHVSGIPYVFNQVANGNYFLGTTAGLYELDQSLSSIHLVEGFGGEQVMSMLETSSGEFWFGTFKSGLWNWDPNRGKINKISTDQGLSNNAVVSILEDANSNIWVNTYHGLNVLNNKHQVISKLFEVDGLVSNEGNRWSGHKMPDGRLAFGSVAGVSIIDPGEYLNEIDTVSPTIFLTQVSFKESGKSNVAQFQGTAHLHHPIRLDASDRSIDVSYALSSLIEQDRCDFAYRIARNGGESEWTYVGSSRTMHLRNLPPGEYQVYIKGANHRGNWSKNQVVLDVHAAQVFYLRTWFFALVACIFIGLLIAWQLYHSRTRRLLEKEVQNRTRTISEQSERLKQLDEAKTRLYTNITHEFRTPLTVIAGSTEHIEGWEDETDMIKRNTAQLLDLVNQMLDLRKIESGQLPLHLVQTDILAYIRYLSESFRSLAEAKGVTFHLLSDESEIVMDYDPDKVARIISNLLSNAIKFTGDGGNVYLSVNRSKQDQTEILKVKVKDTGIGIPEDQLEHIFERFYQVDSSSTRMGEGTGIGLTLVHEMVSLMMGDIDVRSVAGKGTTFTIELPITNTAEPPADDTQLEAAMITVQAPAATVAQPGVNGDRDLPVVLLVEDNADVLQYLVKALASSYIIHLAMNGQEGIDTAIEEVPDIIVSDVMMPEKDGLELCDTLKNDMRTSHIPIILLTAKAELDSRLEGIQRGADAYLSKPFNKAELSTVIDSLLKNRELLRKRYATLEVSAEPVDEQTRPEDAFVDKFRSAVHANIDNEDYGVMQLCRDLGISRTQLHRKITAITGHSTAQLMKLTRLQKARQLLEEGEMNVSEIAYATGFRDPSYFIKVFQQEFGTTPGQYKSGGH